MRKLFTAMTGLAAAAGLAACSDPLEVTNTNNPDVARALATPASIEALVGTSFKQIHQGLHHSNDAIDPQLKVLALESYGSVANFGMAVRVGIPRFPIANQRGNQVAAGNFRDFSFLQRQARTVANGISAIDKLVAGGGTLGSTGANARARSFAFFSLGKALGDAALVYDSAAISKPGMATDEIPPLSGYQDVMTAALAFMDSAIANAATASSIPASWLAQSGDVTRADYIRIVRSYKARYRAGVARTPTERAAVDWTKVIADATNGIQANLDLQLNRSGGWRNVWIEQMHVYQGWHQMSPMYLGMADTSGAYDAWLASSARTPFLIKTPDKRFPSGETRAAQQAISGSDGKTVVAGIYFRNRPGGQDTPGDAFGSSYYDHNRYYGIFANSNNEGAWAEMTRTEIDMLAAEGYIRAGDFAAAATLIDRTRVPNGLPSVAGLTARGQAVPGGAACVPRVPTASGTSTQCGDIWEAMKWEKRIESLMTGYGQWFVDSRGWGDLVTGTAVQWPVPYQELDARQKPIYNGERVAVKGTYGF